MDWHLNYIKQLKLLNVNGIVFGSLTLENKIDINQLSDVIKISSGLDITYHRAIDESTELYLDNMKTLSGKVTNVLTSGGLENSIENNCHLLNLSSKQNLQILCGGGINEDNYQRLIRSVPSSDIHIGSLAYNLKDFELGINPSQIREIIKCLNTKIR